WRMRLLGRPLRLPGLRALIYLKARLLRLIWCTRRDGIRFGPYGPQIYLRRPLLREHRMHHGNACTHNRPAHNLRRRVEINMTARAHYAGAPRLDADITRDRSLNDRFLVHAHNV